MAGRRCPMLSRSITSIGRTQSTPPRASSHSAGSRSQDAERMEGALAAFASFPPNDGESARTPAAALHLQQELQLLHRRRRERKRVRFDRSARAIVEINGGPNAGLLSAHTRKASARARARD